MRYVDREVAWAKRHGIYLILEMHGGRGWNMKWDGSGAPDWAVTQYSPNNDGLSTWIENFWENQTLWTHYANAWSFVASRYSNEPTIVGYDIMNEPYMWYVPGAFDLTKERAHQPYMLRFHELVVDQIRSVDPNHIVFIEPFLLPDRATTREAYSWSQEQIAFDRPNVVWSPHFYVYSLGATYMKPYTHNDIGILEQAMNSLYATFTQFQKPIWIGEFGIEERVPGSDIWTKDVVDLLRAHGFGWAWWAYYREHPNEGSYGLINADGSPRCQFLAYLTDSPQRDTLCPSRSFTASASQVGNQAVPYVPWILLIAGLIVIGLTVRLSRRSVRPLVSAKHA
jgi:endoglycosylceramidase